MEGIEWGIRGDEYRALSRALFSTRASSDLTIWIRNFRIETMGLASLYVSHRIATVGEAPWLLPNGVVVFSSRSRHLIFSLFRPLREAEKEALLSSFELSSLFEWEIIGGGVPAEGIIPKLQEVWERIPTFLPEFPSRASASREARTVVYLYTARRAAGGWWSPPGRRFIPIPRPGAIIEKRLNEALSKEAIHHQGALTLRECADGDIAKEATYIVPPCRFLNHVVKRPDQAEDKDIEAPAPLWAHNGTFVWAVTLLDEELVVTSPDHEEVRFRPPGVVLFFHPIPEAAAD